MAPVENMFIPLRLREERRRIGVTQEAIAVHCDTTVQTVRRWEKKATIPAEKLALLISLGFDIQYVLSGARSVNLTEACERFAGFPVVQQPELAQVGLPGKKRGVKDAEQEKVESATEAGALSPRDRIWLEIGQGLSDDDRTRLQEIGAALVSARELKDKAKDK